MPLPAIPVYVRELEEAHWGEAHKHGGGPRNRRQCFFDAQALVLPPHGAERPDAIPPGGGRPGSDLDTLRSQHLDAYGIDYGILISGDLFGIGGCADADMAAALVSASNDWILEEWVSRDPRLKLSIQVGANDPQLAAKEIGRLGGHREVVQVQLSQRDMLAGNGISTPFLRRRPTTAFRWPCTAGASRRV